LAIEYVIIDMDGTLYAKQKEVRASEEMARRLYEYTDGIGIPKDEVYKLVGKYIRELRLSPPISLLSAKYTIDINDLADYVYDLHPKSIGIKKDEELSRLLLSLRKRKKMALFTNSPLIWTIRVLNTLGIGRIIDKNNLFCFEELDNGMSLKPSERAFRILLEGTTTDVGKTIFLDDSLRNIRTAKSLGMKCIHVSNMSVKDRTRKRDIYSVLKMLAADQSD